MKHPVKHIFLILLLLLPGLGLTAQQICILQPGSATAPDPESTAALMFVNNIEHYQVTTLTTDELKNSSQLEEYQLVWFHHSDSTFQKLPRKARKALKQFVEEGGKLILSLEGARAINELGFETQTVEVKHKKAEDSGYGRKLGLHAFRSHPVFEGLNSGSYIFKPLNDTTLRIIGFFDNNLPSEGRVIAVDWDYIFLREHSKLMLEYNPGRGKVLTIGAYACLSQPNINRQHLRKFVLNCLNYILGGESVETERYWSYGPQKLIPESFPAEEAILLTPSSWPAPGDEGLLTRTSEDHFWDVAGQRMLVMGHENSGIDEIWAHPFMALKDYKIAVQIGDSVSDLAGQQPRIEVRPKSFRRIYQTGEFMLVETIVADGTQPAAVVHYTYEGAGNAQLIINFSSNIRFMWPYSGNVLKELRFGFDPDLNAFSIHAENNEFNVLVGSNVKATGISGIPEVMTEVTDPENFEVSGQFQFPLKNKAEMDVVIAADHRDREQCKSVYKNIVSNTREFFKNNSADDPVHEMLRIISPDPVFNEGYDWAVRATDRFMTHTPGLGTSLVAGIGTTKKGWDGGHKVNGRPGYAWYFGRDGEWSGFALLDYGDFESVKQVLEMYQDYQDLNGKIYHEVSTSGIVHYDASDATPLYIILAGRYLRHSGDLDFIKESWFHIYKALEFCFSTDTDGDHLIENTNVGHGWVEGGGLFGSHSSLYLSACWAAALDEAAYMARAMGNTDQAGQWEAEAARVVEIINRDFWNSRTNFLNQGKFRDGTYHTEPTIMPAIPMYFGQVDDEKARQMLPAFASELYSSDWGCRIVSKTSKLFNPHGYHTGSVWPLFTGWTALAEYANGHPVQGFTHIMDNLLVYRHWGLGFVEEVLNGEIYQPSGVCHHQCWSETMVLQPAIEGLLGLKTDALDHRMEISPQLPADWDSVRIENIRMGKHIVGLQMQRSDNEVTWEISHSGPSSLLIKFDPRFEPGTIVRSVTSTGNFEDIRLSPLVPVEIYVNGKTTLHYKLKDGMGIVPPVQHPQPGDQSVGIRVLQERMDNDTYTVSLEGLSGSTALTQLYVRDGESVEVEGGKIIGLENNIYTIEITFAGETGNYVKQTLQIRQAGE